MRNYTSKNYDNLVEKSSNEGLQEYMRAEQGFIGNIEDIAFRTTVDLGAGHGRVLPFLAKTSKKVVAVEINPDMFAELHHRASAFENATAIQGDFMHLAELLPKNMLHPLFLILQNSLGTIEGAEQEDLLEVIRTEAIKHKGLILLSLFRQTGLESWGLDMYGSLEKMVGKVDRERSDFGKGLVKTDTGYTSKWWTDTEVESFSRIGKIIKKSMSDKWVLLLIDPLIS